MIIIIGSALLGWGVGDFLYRSPSHWTFFLFINRPDFTLG